MGYVPYIEDYDDWWDDLTIEQKRGAYFAWVKNDVKSIYQEGAKSGIMDDEQQTKLARQAYYGYGSVTDFKNYQGLPMPEWEQLTDKIREAWKAAARYAYNEGFEAGQNYEPDHK